MLRSWFGGLLLLILDLIARFLCFVMLFAFCGFAFVALCIVFVLCFVVYFVGFVFVGVSSWFYCC